MIRSGRARKGDGKDVHHVHGMSPRKKNLRVISKKKNRSFKRSRTGKNLGLRKGKK